MEAVTRVSRQHEHGKQVSEERIQLAALVSGVQRPATQREHATARRLGSSPGRVLLRPISTQANALVLLRPVVLGQVLLRPVST